MAGPDLSDTLGVLRNRRVRTSRAERIAARAERQKAFQKCYKENPPKSLGSGNCSPGRRVLLIESKKKAPQTLRGDRITLEVVGKTKYQLSFSHANREIEKENDKTENIPKSGTFIDTKHVEKDSEHENERIAKFRVHVGDFPISRRLSSIGFKKEETRTRLECSKFFGDRPKAQLRRYRLRPSLFPGDEAQVDTRSQNNEGSSIVTLRKFRADPKAFPLESFQNSAKARISSLRGFMSDPRTFPLQSPQICSQKKNCTLRRFRAVLDEFPLMASRHCSLKSNSLRKFRVDPFKIPLEMPRNISQKSTGFLRRFGADPLSFPVQVESSKGFMKDEPQICSSLRRFVFSPHGFPVQSSLADDSADGELSRLRKFSIQPRCLPHPFSD
mmetsp:Transcript_8927/g.10214  ORF Transcript_8927/g.10214 Transcript_8927/m.10214 type:complete len:386 (+) Transcript_8927:191-1348(+)|eukprot:CAMPEP_0184016264 /NCGR_PEP_ID=MMETSP0954-20121128/6828_1 /TAXON_ID=627963 /ORGANISM="Aplanochytrium sp, Strain PBS07" /LENGTH=385 /DNA_ID=CAMNT_0026297257 /DNA_START=282 /DNA_END=1439 /DNA_ORIENTATION=+